MAEDTSGVTVVIGIDIGKNAFHVVGLDGRGAIVLWQSGRGQVEARLANMLPCLIGMGACRCTRLACATAILAVHN